LNPASAAAVGNRGIVSLMLGRFGGGWRDYQSRVRARIGSVSLAADKPWDGSALTGKKLLVWTEYGLGDEIMFAGLLPEIVAQADHCTIVCAPRLLKLFRRSFPRAAILAHGAEIGGAFDARLPLTDAAQLLRRSFADFPRHAGYLSADLALRDTLRARYRSGGKPLVGISWRSHGAAASPFKSTALSDWTPVLSAPDVTFVSLQYGDCAQEIAAARAATGASIIHDAGIDPNGDLDGYMAQVAAMDLVISVSNTAVHAAGALGRPTWAMIPEGQGAHWYWFRGRDDSPWYPSVQLLRQRTPRDWRQLLDLAGARLRAWPKP
jgi:ADP-heptose:LPS heptosyltransferase